jgi:hypothetical protein
VCYQCRHLKSKLISYQRPPDASEAATFNPLEEGERLRVLRR